MVCYYKSWCLNYSSDFFTTSWAWTVIRVNPRYDDTHEIWWHMRYIWIGCWLIRLFQTSKFRHRSRSSSPLPCRRTGHSGGSPVSSRSNPESVRTCSHNILGNTPSTFIELAWCWLLSPRIENCPQRRKPQQLAPNHPETAALGCSLPKNRCSCSSSDIEIQF